MPSPRVRVHVAPGAPVLAGLAAVRAELGVPPEFPAEVIAAAEEAASRAPGAEHRDATDLPFVTVDPAGSSDLDQAFHASRSGDGWVVDYAIADVGWFVRPGDLLDREARRRGVTLYSPDLRTPLYPATLSEGAASLLPDVDRPALLWRIDVGPEGLVRSFDLSRAVVRSREQLTYDGAQREIDGGQARESLALLREVGAALLSAEAARGGVHLPIPEQEVEPDGAGWALRLRAPLPVEDWNAQVSLVTGRCAAQAMLDARLGVLRTLPAPVRKSVDALRRSSHALDVPWADDQAYPDWVRSLDPADGRHMALAALAARLLRGAGYLAFVDSSPDPAAALHAAIAAPYAHVTAPLRRLADRYANEVVLAALAGSRAGDDVVDALPLLPDLMNDAGRRQNALERAAVDFVEAAVLSAHVGEEFDATVVDLDRDAGRGAVQLAAPAVRAPVEGAGLVLGTRLRVRLEVADPVSRTVRFRTA
ncbi:MAG TPA: RNB domain-containing ribonuclease [Mycobacteriales bacterium]|nr:RNB domain-containing ribonuclease [Mycobacteriales bacterium]